MRRKTSPPDAVAETSSRTHAVVRGLSAMWFPFGMVCMITLHNVECDFYCWRSTVAASTVTTEPREDRIKIAGINRTASVLLTRTIPSGQPRRPIPMTLVPPPEAHFCQMSIVN